MKKIIASSALILFSCSLFAWSNEWVKQEKVGGSKRERAVGFAVGNRGYIALGQDTANMMLRDMWEYDPGTNSWTQKADFPGVPRRDAISFVIGTKAYVGTGIDNADAWLGNPLNDFYEYNPVTNAWTAKMPFANGTGQPVYFATGFAVNGKGYVCCGKYGASNYSNRLWEYNPITDQWAQRSPYPGGVRYGLSSFVCGLYAYVGIGLDENYFVQDFWRYNPASNTWMQIASFPGSARYSAATFAVGNRGFVALGIDGGYKGDLWEYDATYNQWQQRANFPGSPRRSAAGFALSGKGYVGTGKGADGTHRDFYQYILGQPLGSDEILSPDQAMSIFPNPMSASCTVSINSRIAFDSGELLISDVCGKLIRKTDVESNTILIEKGTLTKGIYLLHFVSGGQTLGTARLIVE
ncbi:MAG: kelch repeat-containing protein [Bacteroidota bacterium]